MYDLSRQAQQAGFDRHMTALKKYQRLETSGLWRPAKDAQRREVIVSFGDATLVLADKSDMALTHWSLAALRRLNPRQRPAVYSPDPEAIETLEIQDDLMITAIEKVINAVSRKSPHPGRLRLTGFLVSITLVIALTVFWLPSALVNHAARVVPEVTRQAVGTQLLNNIQRLSGRPCNNPEGRRALSALSARMAPSFKKIVVLRSGVGQTEHLPGGFLLMNRSLVEDYETPEVPAGFVIAEAMRVDQNDPLARLLHAIGPVSTLRLLTSGQIPEAALKTYAEDLLTARQESLEPQELLARFEAAGVSSSPYAYALDVSGETTLELIEADPSQHGATRPVLSDGDWVSLQNICLE